MDEQVLPLESEPKLETVYVFGLDPEIKERFKIQCTKARVSMNFVLTGLIEDVVVGKIEMRRKDEPRKSIL